jgi:hypothetical protein
MSDSDPGPVAMMIFTKGGETFTAESLARKLKGAIAEFGEEPALDDDSAVAALAGFDESAEFSSTMDGESLQNFIDEFCEAWNHPPAASN